GRGTRLVEKTEVIPKPLVPIGDKPMLWHIMKIYSHHDHNRFILALGYKGEMIKEYFIKYPWLHRSFEVNLSHPVSPKSPEDWDVVLKDTGKESKIGKRLNIVKADIQSFPFLATYGDGLSDVDINKVVDFHSKMRDEQGVIATITITRPRIQYGVVDEKNNIALGFSEKPLLDKWVNTGFMVLEKEVFKYVKDDEMDFDALKKLAADGKLAVFKHNGFFASMDTYRDYLELNNLWRDCRPWQVWKD
ncbi:MAG: glucose-1-phosphate cytidylyltransferase, partial [Candidatus Diapherotrites archaeon]|nr:glucose-1-phosphate cytidylyltransferase [Candidatus Diapherotrites archaeon]